MSEAQTVPLPTQEKAVKVDREKVNLRVSGLCEKYGLNGAIGNMDRVVDTTAQLLERYQVPESFIEDDVNMALIIGSSQKLVESQDPLYPQRVGNFVECLVEPVAAPNTTTIKERWGSEHTGQLEDRQAILDYAQSHLDVEATARFSEKFTPNIDRSTVIWSEHGYDLQVNVHIVDVNSVELKKMCGGSAFIMTPEDDEMVDHQDTKTVHIVIPSDTAQKNEDLVAHELFHIEDKFGMIRRGTGGRLLESVDELYTEYSVGNYGQGDAREDKCLSQYFNLKQWWCKLQSASGLDSALLGNREVMMDTIISNFGFEGFVDFAMMNAQSSGPATHYETFYKDPQRTLMAMLVSREKVRLRKQGEFGLPEAEGVKAMTDKIANWTSPSDNDYSRKYRQFVDLFPNVHSKGKVYLNDVSTGLVTLTNGESVEAAVAYSTALAYADLRSLGEVEVPENVDRLVFEAVDQVEWHRSKVDFSVSDNVQKEMGYFQDLSEGERLKHSIKPLFIGLVQEMEGVDFVFGLRNPNTRSMIMKNFMSEVDQMAVYCASLKGDSKKYFIQGIYGYNLPWELREFAVGYVSEKYPEYNQAVDQVRQNFDPKRARNVSL